MSESSGWFFIPRNALMGISAALWVVPASILLWRAIEWSNGVTVPVTVIAAVVTGVAYFFWFIRIVRANISRIHSLPERSPFWAVLSPRGYVMIALMVTLGIALRSSDLPRIYLAPPYALMGGCLLFGSLHTARTFLQDLRPSRDRV